MAAAAIPGVSLAEKLSDLAEKAGTAWTVLKGIMPGGPFQFMTTDVRGIPMRVFKNLPPALGDYYQPFFKEFASREWVVYEGERYTYGEAAQMIDALSAELAATLGVRPGDRVGLAMRNLPEFLFAFIAITGMGAVAVPLNALWKSEELEYAVEDSGCRCIVCDPERLELCRPFRERLGFSAVLCRGDAAAAQEAGAVLWGDLLAAGRGKPRPGTAGIGADDDAMIMYTSGTTGFPKGVCHTQRSLGTALKIGELLARTMPEPGAKSLMAVPLFHITALLPIFLWSIPMGAGLLMMRKWDAGEALEMIEREKATRFTGVPTMVRDMLEHPSFTPGKVATMKRMLAGGAPVPPSQAKALREKVKGIESGQGYGLTETCAITTVNRGVDYLKHPSSCGKPIPLFVDVKIKDPETGRALPDGERGEVCIKTAMLMRCYYNKPEATQKAIDAEGYFHSGDVGKMEGGFLYILDRLKDLIIRGGENIDCSEVEAALYSHPAVRECSVFGLPDERLGEVVGAAIWAQDDVEPAELAAHAAKTLAKFKVPEPKHIFLHAGELPKGATGKLDKKGLREQYSSAMAAGPPQSKL